ncbi:DUF2264 domain-containing protein [Martelella endophytica]|uniref:DUF2264 domain-containing protein n=1 Tax=Martelella endophytica TaxID=1486262 RepID=UPI0005F11B5C|nr:DUF2264 domain-containing protein [Martelella endophytica]
MAYYEKFQNNPMRSRADFQRCVCDLFEPLVARLETQGAALDLHEGGAHYDMKSSSLEGIARPLWGIVPLTRGGGHFAHWPLVRRVIAEGTDPENPHFWGDPGDIDQRSVEMAAFGLMLLMVPGEGWHPFSESEKNNLARWLSRIQYQRMPNNNWLFFTVIVQEALKSVGRVDLVEAAREAECLNRLAGWYREGGWYGDGDGQGVDHYGGFAMHFYGLLYALYADKPDERLAALFRERADIFAEPFAHWFADTGETLAVGRSLSYRFATSAFWGALAVSGQTPLSVATIKGLWARQIRIWRDKPIFSADGILSRGYDYPSLFVCEEYNSPTSPYWAMKAFLPLALPEDSPFWTADEAPLALGDDVVEMPGGPMIAQRVEGHAIVHYAAPVHRKVQADKYNKFAYSTRFGMEVNALQYAEMGKFGDNILAFSFDDGANWQMRLENKAAEIRDGKLIARWRSGDQCVETEIAVIGGGVFSRTHRFILDRPALVVETGFAVDRWYREFTLIEPPLERLGKSPIAGAEVAIQGQNGISGIRSLDGYSKTPSVALRTHMNVVSPRTAIPYLLAALPAGEHTIVDAFAVSPEARPVVWPEAVLHASV